MVVDKLKATAIAVSNHLNDILECFKPGAKIAVVVWYPDKPNCDFVLNDPDSSLNDVIIVLERRRDASKCNRCNDTGWLEAIQGDDGSYTTSRPCSCDIGRTNSAL